MPEKGMWTLWDPREAGSQGGDSSLSQSSEGGSELPDLIQGLRVLK